MLNDMLAAALQLWGDLYFQQYQVWGALSGWSILALACTINNRYWKYMLWPAIIPFVVVVPLLIWLPEMTQAVFGQPTKLPIEHVYWFVGGVIAPPMFYVFFAAHMDQRPKLSDVRFVTQALTSRIAKNYNPRRYFDHKKGVFFGLNENGKPIYLPEEQWRKSHCQILGTTGAGKGVLAGVLLTQSVMSGESVIAFDPKNDEFLPLVLSAAAKEAGVPFVSINFLGKNAQWNPFFRKDAHEIDELLAAGLGMADTGTDADFYRVEDRRVLRKFAHFCHGRELPVHTLFNQFYIANPELIDIAKKLYADLEELVVTPAVQASKGLDLLALIQAGAVIYVRGSTRNPRVLKLQKIFLLACMQTVEARDRATARSVILFLDEFKYLLSRSALEALGTIRDKRAHVVVAHQSLGDLRDCGAGLSADAVIGGVVENCAIKVAYKAGDPDTAAWLSELSGTMSYQQETKSFVKAGHLGGEKVGQRTLREAEKPLIEMNQLLMLPYRMAVAFGFGPAKFLFTAPIQVDASDTPEEYSPEEPMDISQPPQSIARGLIDVD